jgi:hypothetical protein
VPEDHCMQACVHPCWKLGVQAWWGRVVGPSSGKALMPKRAGESRPGSFWRAMGLEWVWTFGAWVVP